jgi:hypothetical protein
MLKSILLAVTLAAVGFYGGRQSYRHQPVAIVIVGSCGNYTGVVVTDADGTQHAFTEEQMPLPVAESLAKQFGKNAGVINPCPAKEDRDGNGVSA